MENIIYQVRKHGAVKVQTKDQARMIADAGIAEGYNFEIRKEGWSWLVEDLDA